MADLQVDCETPLSHNEIDDIPESDYTWIAMPYNPDLTGQDCCNLCWEDTNCLWAKYQPNEKYSCWYQVNMQPFKDAETTDTCPLGIGESPDWEDEFQDWHHTILGPCATWHHD